MQRQSKGVTGVSGLGVNELRDVLQKIWKEVKDGLRRQPKVEAPNGLVLFMNYHKPPLGEILKTVDNDEKFREQMLSALDEQSVDEVGWLWLSSKTETTEAYKTCPTQRTVPDETAAVPTTAGVTV